MNSLHELYESIVKEETEMEKAAQVETTPEVSVEDVAKEHIAAGRFMALGYADEMEKIAGSKLEAAKKMGGVILEKSKEAVKAINPIRKGRYGEVLGHLKEVGSLKGGLKAGHRAKELGKAVGKLTPEALVGATTLGVGRHLLKGKKEE